jgi:hypothetical protein
VVIMLTVAFLFTMISIPKITASLFSGAGAIGQDFANSGMNVVRAAAAGL